MKLTAKIKLNPDAESHRLLHETLQRANAISDAAWKNKLLSKFKLHRLCYYDVRERFELTAQVVVRHWAGRQSMRHTRRPLSR